MSKSPETQRFELETPALAHVLSVTLDVPLGGFRFEWRLPGSDALVAFGELVPYPTPFMGLFALAWRFEKDGNTEKDQCNKAASSVRALLKRIAARLPLDDQAVSVGFRLDETLHTFNADVFYKVRLPENQNWAVWLRVPVREFALYLESIPATGNNHERGRIAMRRYIRANLASGHAAAPPPTNRQLRLRITSDLVGGFIQLEWTRIRDGAACASGRVTCTGIDELTWDLTVNDVRETEHSRHPLDSIRAQMLRWFERLPVADQDVSSCTISASRRRGKQMSEDPPFGPHESPFRWLEDTIHAMASALSNQFAAFSPMTGDVSHADPDFLRYEDRFLRKERQRREEEQRRRETMVRLAEERRQKEEAKAAQRRAMELQRVKAAPHRAAHPTRSPDEHAPLPPVPLRIELPQLALQETALPLDDLRGYFLRERAAQWWVSNQSDDLIALPYCRIQRLDYQVRTALRVLGPLRGRALLSDEVGLGKTIEAGLVLKEWLTRGMVRRFLVLTVPSLVDQWEEELSDKFNLTTATTNHAAFRAEAPAFWRENPGIVASLHTVKQQAHLDVARAVSWDLIIVDEAHYLRNRNSQAWQAVNALPRQFLLLLTATPVQNSLEELYNLVTLLQPGQLPSPKEFRARFFDSKRPRQPREPEELRRLLGQVMIRNTRANAGLNLPPRRAETALFEPDADELAFWQRWEMELRTELAQLSPSQQTLWGRLLLQAAGSSPAAWRQALEKFPNQERAKAWSGSAPLEHSWKRKCDLLPPLARGEGGLVVFTQFLQTQAALAESLRAAGVETFVINGATPAPERQPITAEFQKRGGALLLTHSGTEGRNLQFCHRLVNFDLPWNPMEIEQRIGRLHRLGQQHPVRIYNLVQRGTLQEHLLQILQEKLNLFELVVGETGLILGERFAGDEFADEVLKRWRDSEGHVGEALESLGNELAAARDGYQEVKQLDETLFAKDYESL
ncbi:MAG TPA: SNF2-related protein [Verrucomicrobiae bacterium]|nr:SNF2-related protein [Verrucomicrobiae bacterium]